MPRYDADGFELVRAYGMSQLSFDATIANAGSLSSAVDLGDRRAVRLIMPATLDGTAITFQTSFDGSTFNDLYDETGSVVTYTVGVSRSVRLPISDWLGVRFLKIRTGTPSVPVAQSGARTISVIAQ